MSQKKYTRTEAENWIIENTDFVRAKVYQADRSSYLLTVRLRPHGTEYRAVFYQPGTFDNDQPDFEVESPTLSL